MTSSAPDVEAISIGQLAERTGVAPATLRMWEKRHGFPEASRRESGHRRYSEADVRAVVDVLRRREAGIRLDVAIDQVRGGGTADVREQRAGSPSVYADLRRRHPSLHVHRLRKTTLLAMSWAIEDEFCAKADRAALFGSFQRSRFWRPARERWSDLARVASATYVLGEFGPGERMVPGVELVQVGAGSPMRREWAVVCDAPDLPVAMAAWELPGPVRGGRPVPRLRVPLDRRPGRGPRRRAGVRRRAPRAREPRERRPSSRPWRSDRPASASTPSRSRRCSTGWSPTSTPSAPPGPVGAPEPGTQPWHGRAPSAASGSARRAGRRRG